MPHSSLFPSAISTLLGYQRSLTACISLTSSRLACGRAGGVHAHVPQRTREPGEHAGHWRKPERGSQVPERLAGGAHELAGSTSLRGLVVEPVEQDGEV